MSSLSISLSCHSSDFSACFSGLSNAWVYILAWGHFSRMLKVTLPAPGVRPEMPGSYSFPHPAHSDPQPVTLGSWSISSSCFAFRCNDSDMCCFTPFPNISLYGLSSAATCNNWFNNILFFSTSCLLWHYRGLKNNNNSIQKYKTKQVTKDKPQTNGKYKIRQIITKKYTQTCTLMTKYSKENKVQDSDPESKGGQKWYWSIKNKAN